jgi:hypothetical protein
VVSGRKKYLKRKSAGGGGSGGEEESGGESVRTPDSKLFSPFGFFRIFLSVIDLEEREILFLIRCADANRY